MITINVNVTIANGAQINAETITLAPGAILTYNNRTVTNNDLNDLIIYNNYLNDLIIRSINHIKTGCKPTDFEFMPTGHGDDNNDGSAPLIGL